MTVRAVFVDSNDSWMRENPIEVEGHTYRDWPTLNVSSEHTGDGGELVIETVSMCREQFEALVEFGQAFFQSKAEGCPVPDEPDVEVLARLPREYLLDQIIETAERLASAQRDLDAFTRAYRIQKQTEPVEAS